MPRIYLPNGCSFSQPIVFPSNWRSERASVKKPWYIKYRFHDHDHKDAFPKGKQVAVRGMNNQRYWLARRQATEILLAYEMDLLQVKGYNPITGKYSPFEHDETLLSPETYLPYALDYAVKNLKCERSTREDVRSMMNFIKKAIDNLTYQYTPIKEVSRKYIVRILRECSRIKEHWSPHIFNKYRSYLMSLFKILIREEALEHNPVREIDKEQYVRRIRVTLNDQERKEVDRHLRATQYNFWRLMHIFFHSGARITELVKIQGKDVDLERQKVKYTVKKGKSWREVHRTIKDIALPLWREIMQSCGAEDYVFSRDLKPGPAVIRPDQINKRWYRHVKDKLKIQADFYSLKHLNTTEIVSALDEAAAARLNEHTSTAMVIKIYDVNREKRQHEQIRKINNPLA